MLSDNPTLEEVANHFANDQFATRAAGCTVRCCSWALYVSIRNYIYDVNLKQSHKMELNDGASRCAAKNRR